MDRKTFINLVDVAWQDFHAADPGALGIIVLALRRNRDDTLKVEVGGNVPPAVIEHAVASLALRWALNNGSRATVVTPPKLRKAV